MATAWEVSMANLAEMPSATIKSWPFILGFTGIEFLQSWLRSMLLSGGDETSTKYMITDNLLLGTTDTAKFAYWNNYQPPSD